MTVVNVFLDTNIFSEACFNFKTGDLVRLKECCDNGDACLFINQIIIEEVRYHIKNDINSDALEIKNIIKKNHSALRQNRYLSKIENNLSEILSEVWEDFKEYIKNATVLSNENISVDDLFDDYFNFRPPFEEKKKSEFPDAVVIKSIKQYMENNPEETVYVVSKDKGWKNAFTNSTGVYLETSLKNIFDHITQQKALLMKSNLYEYALRFAKEQYEAILHDVEKELVDYDWEGFLNSPSGLVEIDDQIECDYVENVKISDLNIDEWNVDSIDFQNSIAEISVLMNTTVSLNFYYVDHAYEYYDRELKMYFNERTGKADGKLSASFYSTIMLNLSEETDHAINNCMVDFDGVHMEIETITMNLKREPVMRLNI